MILESKLAEYRHSKDLSTNEIILYLTEKDIDFSGFNEYTKENKLTVYIGPIVISFDHIFTFTDSVIGSSKFEDLFLPTNIKIEFNSRDTLTGFLHRNMGKAQHFWFYLTKNLNYLMNHPDFQSNSLIKLNELQVAGYDYTQKDLDNINNLGDF